MVRIETLTEISLCTLTGAGIYVPLAVIGRGHLVLHQLSCLLPNSCHYIDFIFKKSTKMQSFDLREEMGFVPGVFYLT